MWMLFLSLSVSILPLPPSVPVFLFLSLLSFSLCLSQSIASLSLAVSHSCLFSRHLLLPESSPVVVESESRGREAGLQSHSVCRKPHERDSGFSERIWSRKTNAEVEGGTDAGGGSSLAFPLPSSLAAADADADSLVTQEALNTLSSPSDERLRARLQGMS